MQQLIGTVTSLSAQTAKVEVVRRYSHPKYHKIISRRKRYLAQCEIKVEPGECVILVPCCPVSKFKKWKVLKKV